MKNYLISIVIISLAGATGCQQKPSIDIEKEKQAIIDVINAETDAYLAFDFDALADKHIQDSTNLRLSAGRDNYVFCDGWEEVSEYLKEAIEGEESPEDRNRTVSKSNYRIKVYPESAWVLCDEVWTYHYETDTVRIKSIQVRFLEKVDGEWKINFLSFVGTSGYDELDESEEVLDL
jgi:hypothetical protein